MSDTTAYLVDASPYIFRAYHALPETMVKPDGTPANATYGFANFLIQLTRREDLTHLAVAFDTSLTTSFRNEIFPDYKANRGLPPAELSAQLMDCRDVARALGAAVFTSDRYEADDLIASLVERLRGGVARMVIVSGDKDLAQLVDADVHFLDFARDQWMDRNGVRERFGVEPERVVHLQALMGDSVDNIPGVAGIGKKTALRLIQEFGNLSELYQRLDAVENLDIRGARSIRAKLENGRSEAELSLQLATLARDVPLDRKVEDLRYRGADREEVGNLLDRIGFGGLRSRIPRWAPS